jgi:hypothetical protein
MLQRVQSGFIVTWKNLYHFTLPIIGLNYFKFHVSRKAHVTKLLPICTTIEANKLDVQLAVHRN